MITPNEHGVYVDGLERLEHKGKRSKAAILLAHCEDGKWRFGLDLMLRDRFETSAGYHSLPSFRTEDYVNRPECISGAVEIVGRMLAQDWNNPNAASEVRDWLSRLSPPKIGQLALFEFGEEAHNA